MTSEEAEAKGKELETAISSREGTILKQSNPIAKTLSYPIKKHASGFLGILEFQIESEKLLEVKAIIEKDGKIVRHIVIIKEPAKVRRERRSQRIPQVKVEAEVVATAETEKKEEVEETEEKNKKDKPTKGAGKDKVELKDIEQSLDELLG